MVHVRRGEECPPSQVRPSSIGPYGVVGSHRALYDVIGPVSCVGNNAFHITEFAYTGSVEDVCAARSSSCPCSSRAAPKGADDGR